MRKNPRRAFTLLVWGLIAIPATCVRAQFVAGDVAIVGFWADSTPSAKAFAFVALKDIETGTVISFTDNGWLAVGGFRVGEGVVTCTAPAGGIAAGSVVVMAGESGLFNLSTSGDQIIAFEGSIDVSGALTGTLIHGCQDNGMGWDADATSANTSALPAALAAANLAMASELDNCAYTGPTNGPAAALLSAIGDPANWTGSDTFQPAFPTSFTVNVTGVSVPGPDPIALLEAFPNPFNPRTTIRFDLAESGPVCLAVYDVRGMKVRTLVETGLSAGRHSAAWGGQDEAGRAVSAGIYFAWLETGGDVETVRMVLCR